MPGRAPNRVDPSQSPWHLLGAALRTARLHAGKTLEDLGKAACVTATHVGRWERGERPIPKDLIGRVDQAADADGFLVALHEFVMKLESTTALPVQAIDLTDPEAMDNVRRHLLLGIAAAGIGPAMPSLEGIEALRRLLSARDGGTTLADWEETAWEYSHQITTGNRTAVITDLGMDLLDLQLAMSRAPAGETPGWARVQTKLLFLMAVGLSTTGRSREARYWWALARRAAAYADDDGESLAFVGGFEAMQGLFAARPLDLVLDKAHETVAMAKGRPYAGTAEALATIAQVSARLGRAADAEKALQDLADTYERLPDSVTRDKMAAGAWPLSRLLHTQSFVYSHLGNMDAGERAREQVLPTYPAARRHQIALLRLHQSVALVRSGDIVTGLNHAQSVISELPAEERPGPVTTAAGWVADAVPPAQQSLPQVLDYRRSLTSAAKA